MKPPPALEFEAPGRSPGRRKCGGNLVRGGGLFEREHRLVHVLGVGCEGYAPTPPRAPRRRLSPEAVNALEPQGDHSTASREISESRRARRSAHAFGSLDVCAEGSEQSVIHLESPRLGA